MLSYSDIVYWDIAISDKQENMGSIFFDNGIGGIMMLR